MKEFAHRARRENVDDASLREAVRRAERGLIDARIGKFLIKQRVARRNEGRSGGFRSIVFYRRTGSSRIPSSIRENDRDNLSNTELEAYRDFAKVLANLTAEQIKGLIEQSKWIEIKP